MKSIFYFAWLLTYLYLPFSFVLFRFSVHLNLYGFNQPSPLKKGLTNIYLYFFSRSGTTFENTINESYPRNASTGKLNMVLIVIVLVAIFILAIAVLFGILFFRRHQSHKNQGKFFASFPYSLILMFFFFFFFSDEPNIEARSGSYSLVWHSTLLSWCEAFSFFTRLVLP